MQKQICKKKGLLFSRTRNSEKYLIDYSDFFKEKTSNIDSWALVSFVKALQAVLAESPIVLFENKRAMKSGFFKQKNLSTDTCCRPLVA